MNHWKAETTNKYVVRYVGFTFGAKVDDGLINFSYKSKVQHAVVTLTTLTHCALSAIGLVDKPNFKLDNIG